MGDFPGSYRHVIVRPGDMTWAWHRQVGLEDIIPLRFNDGGGRGGGGRGGGRGGRGGGGAVRGAEDGVAAEADAETGPGAESGAGIDEGDGVPAAKRARVAGDVDVSAVAEVALQLTFTLPSGSYATMLVREVTKDSTTVAHQKSLNE